MKLKLKQTREQLNETDKKFPDIQSVIDANR